MTRLVLHFGSIRWLATVATALSLIGMAAGTGCAHRVAVGEIPSIVPDPSREIAGAMDSARRISAGRASKEDLQHYNDSVARLVHLLEPDRSGLLAGPAAMEVENRTSGITDPASVEQVISADTLMIRGFRERIVADGVGAPVVLRYPAEGYSPEAGIFQPATALLEMDQASGAPRLVLHDTLAGSGASLWDGAAPVALRSDFTAPLAAGFAAEDNQRINLPAMLMFERYSDRLGLSQMDLTRPGKIPVVFVHGLKSSPIFWRDTMNELRSDAAVRERFEFWTFGYATGAPIPYSAMELREALKGMAVYREHLGVRTDNVVLVGHSMGGILSRLMTEKSGDETWYEYFTEPVESLPIPKEERDLMKRMAYYEPLPFVRSVIFIATPHAGSDIAGNPIGRLFSGLIQVPRELLFLSSSMVQIPFQVLTPQGRKVAAKVPTSIDQLESDSELLLRLKELPLNPGVNFHSIIGNRGMTGPVESSSDGVVSYQSSHLEGTDSEVVVPSGHQAHDDPAAIAEIQRILREHSDRR